MKNKKFTKSESAEFDEYCNKLKKIRLDLVRRFGKKWDRDTYVINMDYYTLMGIDESDIENFMSNPDVKNKDLTYTNLIKICESKRKRIAREKREEKLAKRAELRKQRENLPKPYVSEVRKEAQRKWHYRLNETKKQIKEEIGFFSLKNSVIPISYYYEYGLTDEDISAMKIHPKFKKDRRLTWQNMLWALGIKKREQRGFLKKGQRYYFVKSEFRIKYGAYLSSPAWKAKRIEVAKRDNFTCQCCGKDLHDKVFHVHHLTYDRIFNENLSDLQTLCPECHMKEHELN